MTNNPVKVVHEIYPGKIGVRFCSEPPIATVPNSVGHAIIDTNSTRAGCKTGFICCERVWIDPMC